MRGKTHQVLTTSALTVELRSAAWRRTAARTFSSTLSVIFFMTTAYVQLCKARNPTLNGDTPLQASQLHGPSRRREALVVAVVSCDRFRLGKTWDYQGPR